MLFPDPSLNAELALLKKAYTLRRPRLGRKTQLVVALMDVLPGLLALPAVKLKFTAPAERVRLIDSVNAAFNDMASAPELTACACAPTMAAVSTAIRIATRILALDVIFHIGEA